MEFEIKNGNGYIKEYYEYSKIISEAELLYISRNKGKEYYDKLKFEGEYINGERNGKGKEYYFDGNFVFEGEYINGKRFGKGKEYYEYGKLKFEGEYFNGEGNGKGKENDYLVILYLKENI